MKLSFIFKAVFHNIKHRFGSVLISVFAIAAAFAFLAAAGTISFGLAATAVNSSLAFPLVVGPAGSSDTALVMSTVFNVDKPHGTLDYGIADELSADPRVAAVFPVIRSDSYMGIPITGVTSSYINEISSGFSEADASLDPNDIFSGKDLGCAVVGSKAASRFEMAVGDTFSGSHGSVGDEDSELHDFEYRVCAILNTTNCPDDFAIFTDLRAVWKIHEHGHHHHREADKTAEDHEEKKLAEEEDGNEERITAVLVRTKNPAATAALEREYSENGKTTATDVGRTVRKIVSYMNKAEKAVGLFSYGTLFLVLTMVFVTILISVNERRKEMALMRTLGIGRLPISLTVMTESLLISLAGMVCGMAGGHILLKVFKPLIDFDLGIDLEPFFFAAVELQGAVVTIAVSVFLSLFAMIKIYSMNLIEEVSKE